MYFTYFSRTLYRVSETALYDLRGLLPQNVPDTTQPEDDVYPRDVYRKAESAGNGVLSSGEKNFSVHKTYMNFSRPCKRAPETALYALRGSLLPENGTIAKPFLSDVYNKGTRASKRLADVSLYTLRWILPQNATDTTQPDDDVYNLGTRRGRMQVDGALSGRSMVEMLGVLAIIGVLSVGAIAGYQKAMFKYKLNKQADQISTLLHNALIYAGEFRQNGYDSITKHLIKLDAVPKEMIRTAITDYTPLYVAMGYKVGVYYSPSLPSYFYTIYIYMDDTKYSKESCRNIVSAIKAYSSDLWQISFNNGATIDGRTFGDNYCHKNNKCIRDMSLYDIDNFCMNCRQNTCVFSIFYGYHDGSKDL